MAQDKSCTPEPKMIRALYVLAVLMYPNRNVREQVANLFPHNIPAYAFSAHAQSFR
jgi:hypothetical protein